MNVVNIGVDTILHGRLFHRRHLDGRGRLQQSDWPIAYIFMIDRWTHFTCLRITTDRTENHRLQQCTFVIIDEIQATGHVCFAVGLHFRTNFYKMLVRGSDDVVFSENAIATGRPMIAGNHMNGIVLTVIILIVNVTIYVRNNIIAVILMTILQTFFACDVIMRESIGRDGIACIVIFRLNAPERSHHTIDTLFIEDVILLIKRDARLERIIAVINNVLVDSFTCTGIIANGFCDGRHFIGCDKIILYHSDVCRIVWEDIGLKAQHFASFDWFVEFRTLRNTACDSIQAIYTGILDGVVMHEFLNGSDKPAR